MEDSLSTSTRASDVADYDIENTHTKFRSSLESGRKRFSRSSSIDVYSPQGTVKKDTLRRHHSLPIILEDQKDVVRKISKITTSHDCNLDTIHNYEYLSLEKPPHIDFYRTTIQKITRASVAELIHGRKSKNNSSANNVQERPSSSDSRRDAEVEAGVEPLHLKPKKTKEKPFGWFMGVYIPSFTSIVGTLLYLRMGYVAGQAGILSGIVVVLFSSFVILITALSLTGICSNGVPKKGGLYYVVSRALGPELGGCIGVIFAIANIGMAALYIVGIAEFISDLLVDAGYGFLTSGSVSDNRVFSLIICVILMLLTFAGPQIENSFTIFFFSTYFISYCNWMIGTLLPVTPEQAVKGVTGYSPKTAEMNLWPDYRHGESIVTVFAVFFPGFTGMMAATMYVDQLQNPGRDVAIGLFSCISTTTVMYIVGVVAAGATMLRDADGVHAVEFDNITEMWKKPKCVEDYSCKYGLMNYHQVAELECAWRPLIVLGMLGMTVGSTMTNLDQGPIIFQAICKDRLFPYMKYFTKEYGPNKEPRRAYVFFAMLTMGLCLVGDLNALNFIVTNLFMVTYALVNYACFDASFVRSPGWRPTFPYYNMWVSLFGAAICIISMFAISIVYSVVTVILFLMTMGYFHYYHPEVNWGDTNQAHIYRNALTNLHKLTTTKIHVKNYRPQLLLMIGNPASRIPLLDFASSITKGDSVLLAAHVIPYTVTDFFFQSQAKLTTCLEQWLKGNKIKAFYTSVASESLRAGSRSFLQTCGLGKLRPNVLMIGFKDNWSELPREKIKDIDEYVGILRDAFEANYGFMILRNETGGFDYSEDLLELKESGLNVLKRNENSTEDFADNDMLEFRMNITKNNNSKSENNHVHLYPHIHTYRFYSDKWMFSEESPRQTTGTMISTLIKNSISSMNGFSQKEKPSFNGSSANSNGRHLTGSPSERRPPVTFSLEEKDDESSEEIGKKPKLFELQQKLNFEINRFHHRVKKGKIDVWWLYDDGGLTLLIPHLLRLPKSYLEGADLRIFILASSRAMVEVNEEAMIAMLTKFRIGFSDVKVIRDIGTMPKFSTINDFENTIKNWKADSREDTSGFIQDYELQKQRRRTMRQLRTRELLQQHSAKSNLIVVTLPIPRADVSACLYLAWLDVMTRNLPPVLLIRGNQTSVLSFYM